MNKLWDKIVEDYKIARKYLVYSKEQIAGHVKKTKECIIYGPHIMQQ